MEIGTALIAALFIALVAERITAAAIAPLFEKFKWDKFYLIYPTWIIGGGIAWLAGINLFESILPKLDPTIGHVLTCVIVGGGSNLIHDIFDKPPVVVTTTTTSPTTLSLSGATVKRVEVKTETAPAVAVDPAAVWDIGVGYDKDPAAFHSVDPGVTSPMTQDIKQ